MARLLRAQVRPGGFTYTLWRFRRYSVFRRYL